MYTIDSLLAGDFTTFGDALSHLSCRPSCSAGRYRHRLAPGARQHARRARPRVRAHRARQGGERDAGRLQPCAAQHAGPDLTVIGYSFAYLITGAVLTETIFSWPGIGSYAVRRRRALDFPAIIGVTIVGGRGLPGHQSHHRHRLCRGQSAREVRLKRHVASPQLLAIRGHPRMADRAVSSARSSSCSGCS